MTITTLSDDTVRLLGSPTVITTPIDLVKELLDNALDANATSVRISISQNTIDKIEVRDNGDGIHSDDYNSVGRTGHTSKITTFEELQTRGAATLGFRGLALASANTLGSVTITTRTTEDPNAVELKLSPGAGGVESQRRVSAPVGTAVNVTGLFRRLPVRAEFAINKAKTSLVKIKQLLHSYAVARPQVRLSFKVLGDTSRQSWSYSPAPGATVKEAVVQVFGVEVMSHCVIRTICSNSVKGYSDGSQGDERLTIEAVLPKPGIDQSKTSSKVSKGSFFAVDARPMSTHREPMKKLNATFKAYYTRSNGLCDGQKTLKDPFMCVDIRCSPGSYDPNVEPSKDSVLFAQESRLTELFERLLSEVFDSQDLLQPFVTIEKRQLLGQRQTRTPPRSSSGPDDNASDPLALVEGRPDQPRQIEQTHILSTSSPIYERSDGPLLSSTALPSLGTCGDYRAARSHLAEPFLMPIRRQQEPIIDPSAEIVQLRPDQAGVLPSAPYQCTLEPVTHPRRRPGPDQTGNRGWSVNMSADPDMSSDEEAEVLTFRSRSQPAETSQQEGEEDADPREGLNPWSIAKMTAPARQPDGINTSLARGPQDIVQVQEKQVLLDGVFDDLPILQSRGWPPGDVNPAHTTQSGIWQADLQQPLGSEHARLLGLSHDLTPAAHDPSRFHPHLSPPDVRHTLPNLKSYHEDVAKVAEPNELTQIRLSSGGPRLSQKEQTRQTQMHIDNVPSRSEPFNPPFRKPKRVKSERIVSPAAHVAGHVSRHVGSGQDNHGFAGYGIGREQNISSQQSSSSPTLLVATSTNSAHGNEKWSGEDSRKYLMSRQRSEAEHRRRGRQPLKRAKTDRLPLERIEEGTQHLVLTMAPDYDQLEGPGGMVGEDALRSYCRAEIDLSDEMDLADVTEIEVRLKSMLSVWTEKILGKTTEVELNIRSSVKGKAIVA